MDGTWVDELRLLSKSVRGPLIATLATVESTKGGPTPDARSVVIRGIGDDGVLMFTSDSRSKKDQQLAANSVVAVVIWLPDSRTQFRIGGPARLAAADSPERAGAWRNLSDSARATFFWPHAGLPRGADDAFAKAVAADVAAPESFRVWRVTPEVVEDLDLRPHPHLRRQWTRAGTAWIPTVVNP
jgi:pyridoxamine 5'-phosphate oxidase